MKTSKDFSKTYNKFISIIVHKTKKKLKRNLRRLVPMPAKKLAVTESKEVKKFVTRIIWVFGLSTEGTLMTQSYVFARNTISKNVKII